VRQVSDQKGGELHHSLVKFQNKRKNQDSLRDSRNSLGKQKTLKDETKSTRLEQMQKVFSTKQMINSKFQYPGQESLPELRASGQKYKSNNQKLSKKAMLAISELEEDLSSKRRGSKEGASPPSVADRSHKSSFTTKMSPRNLTASV